MKRYLIFGGAILFFIGIIAASIYFQSASKRPKPLPKNLPQEINDLPVYDWYVCEILGEGPVPGISEPRLRFRVCHNEGWEILAYCLQPNWPAPEVGAACALIDEDTLWCGEGLQNLRQYALLQTPTPTPTPISTSTSTPTPTSTLAAATATPGTPLPTQTGTVIVGTGTPIAATGTVTATPAAPFAPTATPVQRPSPGGSGLALWLWEKILALRATPTPFLPQAYTPTPSLAEAQATPSSGSDNQTTEGFYGIDFSNPWERIRIKIYPPDKSVNKGKPIVIAFKPGDTCEYRDHTACINTFTAEAGGEITYITVHSGVGSEAEAFRQAIEGMGFDQAAYSLRQVKAHLRALEGARVEIVQGDVTVGDLTLTSAVRIPGEDMRDYLNSSLPEALQMAGALAPSFNNALNPIQPQIVFETCGWMMPGEPWSPGVTSTNASLYLGVIQKKP
jgi:hypothetical protein